MAHVAFWLAIAAASGAGLLAGASLDQSVKQLPARHRIGIAAYSAYSRASDLHHGIVLYGVLGVGAAAMAVAAAIAVHAAGLPSIPRRAADLAAVFALLHSLMTAFAAPTLFSQRRALNDELRLARIFDRFERLQTVRVLLQITDFGLLLWLVVTLDGLRAST
ncbi:MAG: hypothetical protein ACREJD_04140 [Phycisphaerales bacterium]